MSLLNGFLPAAYSAGDKLKRQLGGLLSDPLGELQQAIGHANDRARGLNELTAQASIEDEKRLQGQPFNSAPGQRLTQTIADAYNPIGIHLPHTPLKPNPNVGTRFEREFVGNMAAKSPVKIEDLKGSSLLTLPWDSTSRGYLVKSVSDEVLPQPILTTGGQDFARDLAHIEKNVGGASNKGIAKRIQDRVRVAEQENRHFGGSGEVYMLPTTMGEGAENFSTMPMSVLLGLAERGDLTKKQIKRINEAIKTAPVKKGNTTIRPFNDFKGIETDAGKLQFVTGEGLDTTAGELRKAFSSRMSLKEFQEMLRYNQPDLVNALTDPALQGVGKGYAGNTVIRADSRGLLTPSTHPSYDTNFPGRYAGSLYDNIPVEYLMPKTWSLLSQEMGGRGGDLRNNVIGAMEKRKNGISEIVDQQVIDSVNEWFSRQAR